MKTLPKCLLLAAVLLAAAPSLRADPGNPKIDMKGYLRVAREAAAHRETRRVSEDDFLRLSREPGTLVLDARSPANFALLHVEGAINLDFSDIDIPTLARTLPDKNQRILIYCNNNFFGDRIAFGDKSPRASLNISTYIALYQYGYRNVYELAPYVDVHTTKLSLVGTQPGAQPGASFRANVF